MDSNRVRSILDGIQNHQEISVATEERDLLVAQALAKSVDATTRDRWTAAVAGLPSLRDRVRDLSRQALATPGPDAPPELRQMIADLEELTREKANLDSLVWNGPTQDYLGVTLAGRGVLDDLKAWQDRVTDRSFEEFQKALDDYRTGLVTSVNQASQVYRGLTYAEEMSLDEQGTVAPFTNVDLRFASMILAKRPVDPALLVRSFEFFNRETNWGSWNKEDHLIGSAVLAALPWDALYVKSSFENLRISLEYHGVLPEDRIIVAASLADLDRSWWDTVVSRIDEIRGQRPAMNSLLIASLARSPYSVPEALARFDAALSGMASKGYRDGLHIEAAAAILASAQIPRETMADRFAITASHLAGAFDPPYAPAAMLAASPLSPTEAVEVFRDCIGAVTRTNFFDLTLEIEELALIMSYGVAPLGLGVVAANLPPGVVPQAVAPVVSMAPTFTPYWFVWHNYYVYRPIGHYIATHPVHVHTVAAFG